MQYSTCTTRHNRGCDGLPDDHQVSFLAIEPDCEVVNRPTITLQDDAEKVFQGKSLLFLEIPVVAFPKFFTGYIGSVTPKSKSVISHEFYLWQMKRVYYGTPSSRIVASIACVSAHFNGIVEDGLADAAIAGKACVNDDQLLGIQNFKGLLEVIRLYIRSPEGIIPEVVPVIFSPPSDNSSECLPTSSPTPKHAKAEQRDNHQRGKMPHGVKRRRSPSPSREEHRDKQVLKGTLFDHNNDYKKRCRYPLTSLLVNGTYSLSSSGSLDSYQSGLGHHTNRSAPSNSENRYRHASSYHNDCTTPCRTNRSSSSGSEDRYQYRSSLGDRTNYQQGPQKRNYTSYSTLASDHYNGKGHQINFSDYSRPNDSRDHIRHDYGREEYREKRGHKRSREGIKDDELHKHHKVDHWATRNRR
ncbi:hypothetical protein BDD12DRAFT_192787 [Trichophaea hybrida]|nr:hypothetical protein BDD12DRAFT_192787 [Trichophaea hybrida]